MSMSIELVGTSIDHDFESGQSFNFVLLRIDDFQFRALVDEGVMKQAVQALRRREGLESPAQEVARAQPAPPRHTPNDVHFVPADDVGGSWSVVDSDAVQASHAPDDDFDDGQID